MHPRARLERIALPHVARGEPAAEVIERGGDRGGHLAQGLGAGRVQDQVIARDHVVATEETEANEAASVAEVERLRRGRRLAGFEGLAEALHDRFERAFRQRQGLAADDERELLILERERRANELSSLAGMLVEDDRDGLQGPWTAPRSTFEPRGAFQKSVAGAPSDLPTPRHGEPALVCGTPVDMSSWQSTFT